MQHRHTAIFAYHDEVAVKLMYCLRRAGIRVPEDISVAGVNNTWAGEFSATPLTSVELHMDQQGKECAELIVQRIKRSDRPRITRKIDPQLFCRESTDSPSNPI